MNTSLEADGITVSMSSLSTMSTSSSVDNILSPSVSVRPSDAAKGRRYIHISLSFSFSLSLSISLFLSLFFPSPSLSPLCKYIMMFSGHLSDLRVYRRTQSTFHKNLHIKYIRCILGEIKS